MKRSQEMLAIAIEIATQAHSGQYDKGGNPYILHPLAVMHGMRNHGYDVETQCVAVLHDVLEDTDVTEADLRSSGISAEVIDALLLLNHNREIGYFEYIEAMRGNLRALRVKRGDIEHNSDIRRLKGLRQKDFARLEKYHLAFILVNELIEDCTPIESFKREHLKEGHER